MSNTHLTENAQVFKHFTCDRHLLQEGTQKKGKDKITGVEEPHRHFMRLDERLHNRDELLEEKQVFIHLTIAADERPQQLRVSENEQANVANSGDSSKLVELVEEGFGRGSKNGAKLTDICHLKVVRPEQIDALSSKEIAAQKPFPVLDNEHPLAIKRLRHNHRVPARLGNTNCIERFQIQPVDFLRVFWLVVGFVDTTQDVADIENEERKKPQL